jgi:hypothetical protein
MRPPNWSRMALPVVGGLKIAAAPLPGVQLMHPKSS